MNQSANVRYGSITGQVVTYKGLTFCIDKNVHAVFNTTTMYSKLAQEIGASVKKQKIQGMAAKKYIENVVGIVKAQDVKKLPHEELALVEKNTKDC